MCWNKGRLCWKIAMLFYFCHLKKLVRPETFGPYHVTLLMGLNYKEMPNFRFSLFHWVRKVSMNREENTNFCQYKLICKEHTCKHNSMLLLNLAGPHVKKEGRHCANTVLMWLSWKPCHTRWTHPKDAFTVKPSGNTSVDVRTWSRAGQQKNHGSFPKDNRFFSFPKRPDCLWGPRSLCSGWGC